MINKSLSDMRNYISNLILKSYEDSNGLLPIYIDNFIDPLCRNNNIMDDSINKFDKKIINDTNISNDCKHHVENKQQLLDIINNYKTSNSDIPSNTDLFSIIFEMLTI